MANKRGHTGRSESDIERLARTRPFLDGYDKYTNEYELWKKMTVVRGLLGIFELDDDDYHTKETKELFHNIEVANTSTGDEKSSSLGGWTSAVRNQYGKVQPIIFVRRASERHESEQSEESIVAHKLLVLIHEMGHADDIRRSINYNHEKLELAIVEAELYAHDFVVRHCRKLGYRLMLDTYLTNVQDQLHSTNAAARIAAERFVSSNDLVGLREFCQVTDRVIQDSLEKSGRVKEFRTRYGR
jgi:hypothetical protein